MAYTKTNWENTPSTLTPISAANLNKMEEGIEDAHDHMASSAAVHGISNTANLVYTDDARLSNTRTPTDGSVTTAKIADGAVTTAKILDGTIALGDLAAAVQSLLVPTGSITQFAGSSAPTGWAICNGSELAISAYGDLYAVISTSYGALTNGSGGSGSTHFRLPDFRGRVPLGSGTGSGMGTSGSGIITGGSSLSARQIGEWGGDERLQQHLHSITDPGHTHNIFVSSQAGSSTPYSRDGSGNNPENALSASSNTTGITQTNNQGSGQGGNMPPYVVVNYIIKT